MADTITLTGVTVEFQAEDYYSSGLVSLSSVTTEFDAPGLEGLSFVSLSSATAEFDAPQIEALSFVTLSSATVEMEEGQADPDPIVLSGATLSLYDTEQIPAEIKVHSFTAKLEPLSDLPSDTIAAYSMSLRLNPFLDPTLSAASATSFSSASSDFIPLLRDVVTVLSQSTYNAAYILPPLVPSPDINIVAHKKMQQSGKYTMEAVADHLHSTIGASGLLSGFDIVSSSDSHVEVSSGSLIYKGFISEYDTNETYSDPETFTEPYYLCAKVILSSQAYSTSVIVTDVPGDRSIIAIKDGAWRPANSVRLQNLWDLSSDHQSLLSHTSASESDGMLPEGEANPPSAAYPYVCKLTVAPYELDTAHYVYAMLESAIESTNSRPPSVLENMFADTIYFGTNLIPAGVNGSLVSHIPSGNYGPLGIFADEDNYSIITGVIVKTSRLSDHLMVGVKAVSVTTGGTLMVDVSTDLGPVTATEVEAGLFIQKEDLPDASDGKSHINITLRLPNVSGEGVWTTMPTLFTGVASHCAKFIDNKVVIVGGTDVNGQASHPSAYQSRYGTHSIYSYPVDISESFSVADYARNSMIVFNGKKSNGSIDPSIKEYSLSSQSLTSIGTSVETRSSSGVAVQGEMIHGTGINSLGELTKDWYRTNPYTDAPIVGPDFPYVAEGLTSSRSKHVSAISLHMGGWDGLMMRGDVTLYDVEKESYTVLAQAIHSMMSNAESSTISMKDRVCVMGGILHPTGPTYTNIHQEFSHKTSIFISKNIPITAAGNGSFTLASDGTMISAGGSNSGSVATDSVNKYSEPGFAMTGWGVEWQ